MFHAEYKAASCESDMGPKDEGQVIHVKDLRMCAVAEGVGASKVR